MMYHNFMSAITDARSLMYDYISILSGVAEQQLDLVT